MDAEQKVINSILDSANIPKEFWGLVKDVKTATKILVAQISQQIDTGNLVNPDLSSSFNQNKYLFITLVL